MKGFSTGRERFRDPIPEIAEAARLLDGAVSAHIMDRYDLADGLIGLADMQVLRDYTESLGGRKAPTDNIARPRTLPRRFRETTEKKKECPQKR